MHVIVDSIWDNTETGSISVLEMLHANTFILSMYNINTLALEAVCFEKTLSKTRSCVFYDLYHKHISLKSFLFLI